MLPGWSWDCVDRPSDQQITRWYPRLFRTALRLTGDVEDAADLTQQAFCKGIEKWHRFDNKGRPTTWLHRILVNCFKDRARKKSIGVTVSVEEWDIIPANDGEPHVLGKVQRNELLAQLRQAIEDLPKTLRHAFIATTIDGYTYQEAAELLNVPLGTIASRINAARKQLFNIMRNAFPEI